VPSGLELLVAVLATWRVAHLLAREDGPFGLVAGLRHRAGRLLACPYCLSLWLALPLAAFFADAWTTGLLLWFAISGGAVLLEKLAEALDMQAAPPIIDLPPLDKE
jgi:hypothetical protein